MTLDVLMAALAIKQRHGLSYWDSAIVAAALALGCRELYTEDMHTALSSTACASSIRFCNGGLLSYRNGTLIVMAALDAAIQEKTQASQEIWMAGSSPAMTTLALTATASLPRLPQAAR